MSISRACLALVLTLPAAAQSFNVDVGQNLIFWPTPSSSYSAASGQNGHWNGFNPSTGVAPLADLSGASTGVTLSSNESSSFNLFPSVISQGDDQAFLEDFLFSGGLGQTVVLRLEGLELGNYQVYTYAADPSSGADLSLVTVLGSNDPTQGVQGPWIGSHQLGTSYARHNVTTTDGVIEIQLLGGNAFPNDRTACNGIQLVFEEPLGTIYCTPAVVNTSGQPAQMQASGSALVLDNDVTLEASNMPVNQLGIFLISLTPGLVVGPSTSVGNLCLVGGIGRYDAPNQVQNSGASGSFNLLIDLNSTPTTGSDVAILSGQTWYFQTWFRDFVPGIGATSNFTDGIEITFQ